MGGSYALDLLLRDLVGGMYALDLLTRLQQPQLRLRFGRSELGLQRSELRALPVVGRRGRLPRQGQLLRLAADRQQLVAMGEP